MNGSPVLRVFVVVLLIATAGCEFGTDAATRLAYDLKSAEGRLGQETGARYVLRHRTPSRSGQCTGPYTVQLDKVGALIFWCRDASGETVASPGTSYHRRFVDTPRTYLRDKGASEMLIIELERRDGRAMIVDVR